MRRKKQLLMLLGVLLLVALYNAYMGMPTRQKAPATVRSAANPTTFSGLQSPAAEQKILLERLQRKNKISDAVKRDIFNFYVKPVVVKQPVQAKPVAPPPPPVIPVKPVAPPPPVVSVDVKYLGLLEKGGQQVFFLGLDGDVVVARIGQNFGNLNQYRIKSFDGEQLVISQNGNRPDINLKVGEVASRGQGHASAGIGLPKNTTLHRPANVSQGDNRPDINLKFGEVITRSRGNVSTSEPLPYDANVFPQRPANAPRLKSFKIRKPALIGQ